MTKEHNENEELAELVHNYEQGVGNEFNARWEIWPIDASNPGPSEVLIGLLHRQYTLALGIATNPGVWTIDLAPNLLRSMVEVHIWMAWILKDPSSRAKQFIEDGLGKEKLVIKHRTDELNAQGMDSEKDMALEFSKAWIESHMYSFFIDVNLSGSWSGLDTRKMAEEAGCIDFYRFTYPMYSATVHNTWNHIGKYDLTICNNPLHGQHRIPTPMQMQIDPEFFFLAAKYLDKTFKLIDVALHTEIDLPSTFEQLFYTENTSQQDDQTE